MGKYQVVHESMVLKPCPAVLECIESMRSVPELIHLTGGEWLMFRLRGMPIDEVDGTTSLLDMLVTKRCNIYCASDCIDHTMSRGDAKKLLAAGGIRRTDLAGGYFVLTNKNGSRTYGFFKCIDGVDGTDK